MWPTSPQSSLALTLFQGKVGPGNKERTFLLMVKVLLWDKTLQNSGKATSCLQFLSISFFDELLALVADLVCDIPYSPNSILPSSETTPLLQLRMSKPEPGAFTSIEQRRGYGNAMMVVFQRDFGKWNFVDGFEREVLQVWHGVKEV